MARTKIKHLTEHLFAQLERLGDESITGDQLREEINRSKAMTEVAHEIVLCGELVLKARIAADNTFSGSKVLPGMLEDDPDPYEAGQ